MPQRPPDGHDVAQRCADFKPVKRVSPEETLRRRRVPVVRALYHGSVHGEQRMKSQRIHLDSSKLILRFRCQASA